MRRLLLLLITLLLLSCAVVVQSQTLLPLGYYSSLSPLNFGASAIGVLSQSAILEIEAQNKALLTMLLVDTSQPGSPQALLTLLYDIGFSPDGDMVVNIATDGCVLNTLEGQFPRQMCAIMANACPNVTAWSTISYQEPFANNTYVIFSQLCGMKGVQVFACQSAGSCYTSNTSLPVLPTGTFSSQGQLPAFPFSGYAFNSMSITVSDANTFAAQLEFQYNSQPHTTFTNISLNGVAVIMSDGSYLITAISCKSLSDGGPGDLCSSFIAGCALPTVVAQYDSNPGNNATVLQFTDWCSSTGVAEFKCAVNQTCSPPLPQQTSGGGGGGGGGGGDIRAGTCMGFQGENSLGFVGGCTVTNPTTFTNLHFNLQPSVTAGNCVNITGNQIGVFENCTAANFTGSSCITINAEGVISWTQSCGPGSITAGNCVVITGNSFAVNNSCVLASLMAGNCIIISGDTISLNTSCDTVNLTIGDQLNVQILEVSSYATACGPANTGNGSIVTSYIQPCPFDGTQTLYVAINNQPSGTTNTKLHSGYTYSDSWSPTYPIISPMYTLTTQFRFGNGYQIVSGVPTFQECLASTSSGSITLTYNAFRVGNLVTISYNAAVSSTAPTNSGSQCSAFQVSGGSYLPAALTPTTTSAGTSQGSFWTSSSGPCTPPTQTFIFPNGAWGWYMVPYQTSCNQANLFFPTGAYNGYAFPQGESSSLYDTYTAFMGGSQTILFYITP